MDTLTLRAALDGRRTGPAIFAIQHKISKKRLLVATTNLAKRLSSYCSEMRRGRSHNADLAADLAKDGYAAFEFHLLYLPDNLRELRPLKRLCIEDDRLLGKSYHPPEPVARDRLLISNSLGQSSTALSRLIERLQQFRLPSTAGTPETRV